MSIYRKNIKKTEYVDTGWEQTEAGYQNTRSPLIILKSMERLKIDRRFVSLTKSNYVSGNTIIVDFSAKHMEIDRPLDWPLQLAGPVFVRFQDNTNVHSYYKAKIIKVTDNAVITEFPFELYRLQRRQYYRVPVPGLNSVTFQFKGGELSGLTAQDISIRGVLLCKKTKQLFDVGDEIENLSLEIYTSSKGKTTGTTHNLHAQQGEVVRLDKNTDLNHHIAGIKLFPDRSEEKTLQKYVRQRELSDLRKLPD